RLRALPPRWGTTSLEARPCQLAFRHAGLLRGLRCVNFNGSAWHPTCALRQIDSAGVARQDALYTATPELGSKEYGKRVETGLRGAGISGDGVFYAPVI